MLSKTNSKYKTVSFTLQPNADLTSYLQHCSYMLKYTTTELCVGIQKTSLIFYCCTLVTLTGTPFVHIQRSTDISPASSPFLSFLFSFFFEDKNLSKQLQESHFFLSALNFKDPLFVVAIAAR